MSDCKSAYEKIERMFTSANSTGVERAVILKEDWEMAKQYLNRCTEDGQSPADGWVRCEDRLPTEADADVDGNVWVYDKAMFNEKYRQTRAIWWTVKDVSDYTHWMPTGLKRPQPPQEGE